MDVTQVNEILSEMTGKHPPLQKKDPRILEAMKRLEQASDKLFIPTPMRNEWKAVAPGVLAMADSAAKTVGQALSRLAHMYKHGE